MQMRHTFNALAMELRFSCIKPPRLCVVDGNRSLRDVINPLVSLLYLGNQRPNHHPLPRLSVRLLGRQAMIKGRPRNPSFHLIELSLPDVIVANIAIDNATLITIQICKLTYTTRSLFTRPDWDPRLFAMTLNASNKLCCLTGESAVLVPIQVSKSLTLQLIWIGSSILK